MAVDEPPLSILANEDPGEPESRFTRVGRGRISNREPGYVVAGTDRNRDVIGRAWPRARKLVQSGRDPIRLHQPFTLAGSDRSNVRMRTEDASRFASVSPLERCDHRIQSARQFRLGGGDLFRRRQLMVDESLRRLLDPAGPEQKRHE
jgi:hypothetical protein